MSKTNKAHKRGARNGGGRGTQFHGREPFKRLPDDSLIMLKADGSNSVRWKKALSDAFLAKYETLGDCLIRGGYTTMNRVALAEVEWQDKFAQNGINTIAEQRKWRLTAAIDLDKITKTDYNTKKSMWGLVRQRVLDECLQPVERQQEYQGLYDAVDVVGRVTLIQSTITNALAGLDDVSKADMVFDRWTKLVISPYESITDYVERCKEKLSALTLL